VTLGPVEWSHNARIVYGVAGRQLIPPSGGPSRVSRPPVVDFWARGDMNVKILLRMGLLLFIAIITASAARAATYYVDYTNGNDSNNGTSKATPWKHAPGMNGCSGACNSASLNAGDKVILKGCVTWPNSAFSWSIPFGGSAGNPIYYGVDQTWWDSTVSGCASAWNRPIFNLGNANPSDSLNRIILYYNYPYVTLDNFEITNIAANWNPTNGSTGIFAGSPGNSTVENMYVHGWVNPCFSIGTGNLSAGSSTVTNYVPLSYSPAASAITTSWGSSGPCQHVLVQAPNGGIPLGNNTPEVTSVSGSNPYTVTFTNTSGGASGNCSGCLIQVGADFFQVFEGIEGPTNNDIAQDNVIDGSDTAEVKLNPYGDCGLTEGNNNFCVASGTVLWRVPNIFRNNVIRFVENAAVGECTEWSGNLIEYVRMSTDPTAHTNFVECLNDNPVNGATLFYNNVIRHGTNPNTNTPTGRWAVGVGAVWYTPVAGETSYFFNNIFYDVLENNVFERASSLGTTIAFNNSVDCGASWSLINLCANELLSVDIYQNNLFVTSASPALTGSGFASISNLTIATGHGYGETETPYAFAPPSGGATIGKGTSIASLCSGVSSAQPAAGTACGLDTAYAVTYNTSNHTVTIPARTQLTRPSTPDIGAYQYSASSAPTAPLPPTGLAATVN
jgi:hypothetical protein